MVSKEQKQAKKEAKKLAKIQAELEARRQSKRLELQREVKTQTKTRNELDRTWREMMLKIKEPIFRQDIQVMWHVFERAYDKKDKLINYTLHLCIVAEDQFQRTLSSFCDIEDTIINKFLVDLENMSAENDRRTVALLKLGDDTDKQIMDDHNVAETHLQLLLFHAQTTSDNAAWTTRGENLVKEDEENMKFGNERVQLRSLLENNFNNIWEKYKSFLKDYVVNTSENQKKLRKLRVKENQMADIIATQGKKILSSDGLLKRLRSELAAYESGAKQAIFRARRDRHRDACSKLKSNLYTGVATDISRLETLVKCSNDTEAWIDAAYKKGEKIMRMASLCRKFETQREKTMPFSSFRPHSPMQTKCIGRRLQPEEFLVENELSTSCGLTRLWQRISKAELTKRALMREKMLLLQENAALERKVLENREQSMTPPLYECICNSSKDTKKVSN